MCLSKPQQSQAQPNQAQQRQHATSASENGSRSSTSSGGQHRSDILALHETILARAAHEAATHASTLPSMPLPTPAQSPFMGYNSILTPSHGGKQSSTMDRNELVSILDEALRLIDDDLDFLGDDDFDLIDSHPSPMQQ
uniref:Uncharacterized protein n=1 Tax=Craspedostauros australis TaxID=1486917 RepID=A0A7S0F4V2_9STRA|mmetsp:Transcript_5915/g.16072  ORF Transcript_5915/g.16072 Transcript_5915/m.16072 type:complete len:139 (+) Transcript_5915:382-798(+)